MALAAGVQSSFRFCRDCAGRAQRGKPGLTGLA